MGRHFSLPAAFRRPRLSWKLSVKCQSDPSFQWLQPGAVTGGVRVLRITVRFLVRNTTLSHELLAILYRKIAGSLLRTDIQFVSTGAIPETHVRRRGTGLPEPAYPLRTYSRFLQVGTRLPFATNQRQIPYTKVSPIQDLRYSILLCISYRIIPASEA